MEEGQNIQQETVKIKVSRLMKKCKHKEDRFNFWRQKGKNNLHVIINLLLYIGLLKSKRKIII